AQVPWAEVFGSVQQAMALAPESEDAHALYGHALALRGWHESPDVMMALARADGAWAEVLHWERLAEETSGLWRSGRAEGRIEALTRLGRGADVETARTQAERAELDHRPSSPLRVRFDGALELTGVEIPPEVRAGSAVRVRYWWRALQPMPRDYAAFVHVLAPDGRQRLDQDHRLGEAFGTSRWGPGERTEETRTLVVPAGPPARRF